ncbi:MAG: DUF5696 domain-containing protein, partial [Eubacteriales bacterium]|nr:DUF5696 domain-containing protein [Eubacteriales bacterium]
MKKFRFISALLTFIMVFGAVGNLSVLPVYAAEATEEEAEPINYLTEVFATAEDKLATMELKLDAFGYELYYEKFTGEVAYREKATGQIMFTNPYDIPKAFPDGLSSSDDTKAMLLSQLIIRYTDNDKEVNFYSYTEAAARDQIVQKNIKNGIRVEYTMGREETRKLVPRHMNMERFNELILAYIDDPTAYKKITAFYTKKDPNDPELTERAVKELQATFPITTEMAIYVFDPYASERELNLIEQYIKTYCPHYTYETLQEDHNMTDYEGTDQHPALFQLSLEYYLDEGGLTVRLPANGIRFDEGNYSLTYIMVLPFMGAGSSDYTGYTFYPDGSGTLVRFEDIQNTRTITGDLYGIDFAYHKLTYNHMETLRLPVYGVVENYKDTVTTTIEEEIPGYYDDYGDYIEPTIKTTQLKEEVAQDRGYLAIIEEGDALAKITTNHGAFILHRYNSCYTTFYPRPKDSYNLAESISVGANAEWTVVSKRKYTGSYIIRFVMLTDHGVAEENNITDYYECSYIGMAKVYRDYLEDKGILTRLTDNDVKQDIPLYIESFGIMDVLDTFLSIPVVVKTPLTTFENLTTMYNQLSEAGITNLNFRLKGFTNGGMRQTVPYKVKFEKKVGGDDAYVEFLEFAAANGFGVFPDFDFMYANRQKAFDGYSSRTDAVRTIDNRYTRKREYDSATQGLRRTGLMAISPVALNKFYTAFSSEMESLGLNGISVATLGTDLNSDFDKKEPYNREDAKGFVTRLFDDMIEDCDNIMVDGGNAYTLKYVSHILNASINSSNHTYASEMVPFFGMVLHGYINFAGPPTNMAGDINYEILKMIESGAAPYFTLSYQNISELKDDWQLSSYYSVSYDIWFDDLVTRYNQINEALGSLQTSRIDDHEFLIGERVPTDLEIEEDRAAEEAEAEADAEAEALKAEKDALKEAREKYLASLSGEPIEEPEEVPEEPEEEEEEEDEDEEYVY